MTFPLRVHNRFVVDKARTTPHTAVIQASLVGEDVDITTSWYLLYIFEDESTCTQKISENPATARKKCSSITFIHKNSRFPTGFGPIIST
jgi:hypothetical protein